MDNLLGHIVEPRQHCLLSIDGVSRKSLVLEVHIITLLCHHICMWIYLRRPMHTEFHTREDNLRSLFVTNSNIIQSYESNCCGYIDFFLNSCHHVMAIANLFCNSCHHVMATYTLFLNSCHYVTANFWARVLGSQAAEDACFRMKITVGVVLIRSLVFHVCVAECSRNDYGVRPYLWVQEKFV